MVQLADGDIRTREVLDWKGIHLFHAMGSSCSQKTRVFLALKGIDWVSHPVDLGKNENLGAWYLGINPRGLVPTLVIDGAVHIESNDILVLLDARFPEPKLIPAGRAGEVGDLLRHEDDLHHDLRTLSFRFTRPQGRVPKSPEALAAYRDGGSGTVLGVADANKQREIAFWERVADEGITDEAVRNSAARFRAAFEEIDRTLADRPYMLGESLSVLDIAWFIYVNRLIRCGYPFETLHSNIMRWFEPLSRMPEFAKETAPTPEADAALAAARTQQAETGATLSTIAGF